MSETLTDDDVLRGLFEDKCKTPPWHNDEFLHVDGFAVVYRAMRSTGIDAVFLPGGRQATLAELVGEGRTVALPKRWRYER